MSSPTSHTLDVPGARLYYEVRGSGPTLMLVGHPMGTSGFDPIAPLLADEFTVVTYDPRGFARSTIDDPNQDAEPDLLADDARRVSEAVGELPAARLRQQRRRGHGAGAGLSLPQPRGDPDRSRAATRPAPV